MFMPIQRKKVILLQIIHIIHVTIWIYPWYLSQQPPAKLPVT